MAASVTRRGVLVGAGALGVAAAGGRAARAQKKLEKMQIFIGTTPHFGNIIIGDKKGFYEKHGLPVEITNFASGSTAVDAFRGGRGHIVVSGDLPAIRAWNQGAIGLCPQAGYSQLSIIVAKKDIKSPADLRGKKVGVLLGSTSEFFAKLYLASGKVELKDVDLVNLRPAEMVTGLARGDIQAFVIWQPFGWRALQAVSDAHIVTDAGPYFYEWEACTTSKEYAKDHEAELVAFLKGLDEAGKWIPKNLDEAAKIIAQQIRLDDPKLARDMIERIDWNIAYTPKFRKDMEVISEFINIRLDWATMFEPKYLRRLGPDFVS